MICENKCGFAYIKKNTNFATKTETIFFNKIGFLIK